MNLDIFFNPKSIVIVGVSLTKMNRGQMILLNNLRTGYKGKIYGIGGREGELNGLKIYDGIESLPEIPDVAVIVIPAESVAECMIDCGKKGIKNIVIETAGFSELSVDKRQMEDELLDIADRFGMTMIGPNCIGTINTDLKLAMPFGLFDLPPESSGLSIVSQSGGLISSFMRLLYHNNILYRKIVSIGNKLQLDETDFFEYYINDNDTDRILLYIESIMRGRKFFSLCMGADKPVIIHKSNRYPQTAKVAQSHTTALSADDAVIDAAFRQSAVIRVEGEDELVIAGKALKMPLMKGINMAIISRSGGHGVITTDACSKYGFKLVEFNEEFIKKLNSIFDFSVIKLQNPLDLGEILDYTLFSRILEEVLKLGEVDGVISFLNYQEDYEGAKARTFLDDSRRLSEKYNKPVAQAFVTSPLELMDITMSQPYPVFQSTLQAAQALAISRDYCMRKKKRDGRGRVPKLPVNKKIIESIKKRCEKDNRIPLTDEALKICSAIGLNTVKSITISPDESLKKHKIKFPVALKLLSKDASHKSDVGGVVLNINSKDELSRAIEKMKKSLNKMKPGPAIDGFLIQQMAAPGEEFFIGGRQDPSFGPIVIAGFGGIFLEVIKDTSIRIAPVTKNEALDMLSELKMYPVIKGTRGRLQLDINAMADAICRISSLLAGAEYIKEIDLNPVMVYPDGRGLAVVDARVFFE